MPLSVRPFRWCRPSGWQTEFECHLLVLLVLVVDIDAARGQQQQHATIERIDASDNLSSLWSSAGNGAGPPRPAPRLAMLGIVIGRRPGMGISPNIAFTALDLRNLSVGEGAQIGLQPRETAPQYRDCPWPQPPSWRPRSAERPAAAPPMRFARDAAVGRRCPAPAGLHRPRR